MLTYFRLLLTEPARARKAIVGALTFLSTAATLALAQGDVLPERWVKWVAFGVTLLGAVLTYAVPNERDDDEGN